MAKQSVYKLEGKSPNEVKQSFVHYMGDKNATSKQIKDAANSRYVKIDTLLSTTEVMIPNDANPFCGQPKNPGTQRNKKDSYLTHLQWYTAY